MIGVDGGYLRSRHRRPERNFEVIAGKVLNLDGLQHRFAFARNGNSVRDFADVVVGAGVRLGTPTTVLSDGAAGLWKLQRQVLPQATLVLDWFHIAIRFEHALQAARGLGAGNSGVLPPQLSYPRAREFQMETLARSFDRISWALGALLAHWFDAAHVRDVRGAAAVQRRVSDLIEYLYSNQLALVNYGRRRHDR